MPGEEEALDHGQVGAEEEDHLLQWEPKGPKAQGVPGVDPPDPLPDGPGVGEPEVEGGEARPEEEGPPPAPEEVSSEGPLQDEDGGEVGEGEPQVEVPPSQGQEEDPQGCLLYTSPSPRD